MKLQKTYMKINYFDFHICFLMCYITYEKNVEYVGIMNLEKVRWPK